MYDIVSLNYQRKKNFSMFYEDSNMCFKDNKMPVLINITIPTDKFNEVH